jgi:hypothetical protein
MSQKDNIAAPIQYNTILNPVLWDHDRLKSEVRGALIRMAKDFIEYVGVPFSALDVVITGGNVNYNYTSKSDIDLHIIADFDSVQCDREVAELFDTKRLLYKRNYDLTIHNIPVELYIEDHRMPAVSSGSYSVASGKWLTNPTKNMPKYNEEELAHMVTTWKKVLGHAVKTGDLQTCRKAVQLLRSYRKQGLKTPAGEFSIPNLVYKSLRNDDTLKSIMIFIDRLHDQELSI